jgi:prepilin-type N-terminal cleavage/methylation domain-containing protein
MRGGVWVRAERGFSLIELIGVLAIMGILASMTVPPILRQIRQAQTVNEDANLNEVARAIVEGIKATGTIPNPNVVANNAAGWSALAQPYTALSQDGFRNVFPGNSYSERRYYLDPTFDAYLQALSTPYQTPPTGFPEAGFPVGALRILIVSSSRGISNPPDSRVDPVLPGNAGVNLTLLDQQELRNWNKVFAGGVVAVPALPNNPFSNLWNSKGEYLHVKVVDLRPLFCRVELADTAAPEKITDFTVSTAGTGYPPSSSVQVNYNGNILAFRTTPCDTYVDVNKNEKYDLGDILNDNNSDGAYNASGGITMAMLPTFSQCSGYNNRHIAQLKLPIPGGSALFDAPKSPDAPTYDLIATVGPGAGSFLVNQTQTFYVLKGQSINLFDGANALNRSVIIQSDAQYKYYNNTWNQVD